MQIAARPHGAALLVEVGESRIDAAIAIQFKEAMRAAVTDGDGPVVLDLSNVQFLDSSGLGALVALLKMLGRERPLELACLQPTVAKVLRLTRMDTIFTIHETVPPVAVLTPGE
jgi:anti-sigma B factor antagonist